MKKQSKKLVLNRETFRSLDPQMMEHFIGGTFGTCLGQATCKPKDPGPNTEL